MLEAFNYGIFYALTSICGLFVVAVPILACINRYGRPRSGHGFGDLYFGIFAVEGRQNGTGILRALLGQSRPRSEQLITRGQLAHFFWYNSYFRKHGYAPYPHSVTGMQAVLTSLAVG